MSRTLILSHTDCDGLCSAAIVLSKFPESAIFFTKPVSFLSDLRDSDAAKIIICDIAITKSDAKAVASLLESKSRKSEIIYFDHHELPAGLMDKDIKISKYVHQQNVCTSELVYRNLNAGLPEERIWLALYGAIGDFEDSSPFVKDRILSWDRRALYFEVSTLILGIKNREFDSYDAKRRIVRMLSKGLNPSDVPGLVKSAKEAVTREFELYEYIKSNARKKGKVGYVEDVPHFGFRGPSALFSATVTNSQIGLCAYDRREYIDVTARKRGGDVRLNRLMEKAAEMVGGSGGGLPSAAGARIPSGKWEKFLQQVNKILASE